MADLTVWRPNEGEWVKRYINGESEEAIASADNAPVDAVRSIVYAALDRRELASVEVRRARRVAQLEKALSGQLSLAEKGDPKAAGAVAKIVPELCQLEGLYPGGGTAGGSPAARAPGQTAEAGSDPMRRARYLDYFLHPDRDPDLLPALIEAGWSHPAWTV